MTALTNGRIRAREDGAVERINLAGLIEGANGQDFTYAITRTPVEGIASLRGPTLRFQPGADFQDLAFGEARVVRIEVAATDPAGQTHNGVVTVRVVGANDAPEIESARLRAVEDGPIVRLNLDTIATDIDGDALTYEITGLPSEGKASIRGSTLRFDARGAFQDLAAGEVRTVEIGITATDPRGARATEIVTVRVVGTNDAPEITPVRLKAVEDGPVVRVNLNSITSDPDSGPLTFAITGHPDAGQASIRGNMLRFVPGRDFDDLQKGEWRDVDIELLAHDGDGGFDTEVVTVRVRGRNDAPEMTARDLSAIEDGAIVRLNLDSITDDVDGDTLTYEVTGLPSEGKASIRGSTLRFDPRGAFQDLAAGETRDVHIEVTAMDPHGATATDIVTVTVTGTDDAPVFRPSVLRAPEDGPAAFVDLMDMVTDPDGGAPLNFTIVGEVSAGRAWIRGTRLYFEADDTFQNLAEGESRSVVVQVLAHENGGTPEVHWVMVEVYGQNDLPRFTGSPYSGTMEVDIADYSWDRDTSDRRGGTTYEIIEQPPIGHATIDGSVVTFVPDFDTAYLGHGEYEYVRVGVRLTDSGGASIDGYAGFRVYGVNDAPVALAETVHRQIDNASPKTVVLETGFFDVDGDNLSYSIVSGPEDGAAQINGRFLSFDPTVDFQDLAPGESRTVSVEVRAHDGRAYSEVQTIELEVVGGSLPETGGVGFEIVPDGTGTFLGEVAKPAGDLNNDGIDDIYVVTRDDIDGIYAPKGFVVFGRDHTTADTFPPSLSAASGGSMTGLNTGGLFPYLGDTMVPLGDFNGDGIDDILVGDLAQDRLFVLFGRADGGFDADIDLSDLDGSDGFALVHGKDGQISSVTAADVNGDGLSDILFDLPGDSTYSPEARDTVVAVFGRSDGFGPVFDPSDMAADEGVLVHGADHGRGIFSIGDVNGDGFDDLAMDAEDRGGSYIVAGQAGGWWTETDGVAEWDLSGSTRVIGPSSYSGYRYSEVPGDVTGDGIDDIMVQKGGTVYAVEATDIVSAPVLDLDGADGFTLHGDYYRNDSGRYSYQFDFGLRNVTGAGDLNNDGIEDLVISAWVFEDGSDYYSDWTVDISRPMTFVIFGGDGPDGSISPDGQFHPEWGYEIYDFEVEKASYGVTTTGAGDVNGDGIDDLLIGSPGTEDGKVHVLFGGPVMAAYDAADGDIDGTIDLSTLPLLSDII